MSQNAVGLTWNTNKGNNTYKFIVQRKLLTDGDYTNVATVTETGYTDTGLEAGTTYRYRIKAVTTDDHFCAYSLESDVTTATGLNLGDDFKAYITYDVNGKHVTAENGNAVLRGYNGNLNQIWRFVRQADSSYKIISEAYGDFNTLDVSGWGSEAGTNVGIYYDNDYVDGNSSSNQRWYITETNGKYRLKPKCSECVLDVSGGGDAADGTNMQLWTYLDYGAQEFYINKTESCILDVNAIVDGEHLYHTNGFATFDAYVNGELKEDDVTDAWISIPKGISYEIADVKTIAGYSFEGAFGGALSGRIEKDTVLELVLNANRYIVRYEPNGGNGEAYSSEHTYNRGSNLTQNYFERDGFAFVGWNTLPDGDGQQYEECETVKNLTDRQNGEIVLYAQWKEKADDKPTCRMLAEDVSGNAGENVTISVKLEKNPGIAGFKLKINYDRSVLVPISIEKGAALSVGTLTSNIQQGTDLSKPEYVSAFWSSTTDVTENGEILKVMFKISENAEEGTYPVTITYAEGDVTNQNYQDVELEIENGSVSVNRVLSGDVLKDGKINTKDSVRLNQYLADWSIELSDYEKNAADVFKDGKINTKDSVKLNQYLADWNVELSELLGIGVVKFEVKDAVAENGCADVSVVIAENSAMAGFKLKLSYDNTMLVPVSITKGEALPNGTMTSNIDQGGDLSRFEAVSVFWSNQSNVTSVGTAFTVRFKIAEGVSENIPVTLSFEEGDICDQSYNDLAVTLTNGCVRLKNDYDYTVKSVEGVMIDGRFYAEAEIVKNTDRDETDTIIIGVYKDDALVDTICMRSKLAKGQSVIVGDYVSGNEEAELRAFVWDDMTHMNPLSNTVKKK